VTLDNKERKMRRTYPITTAALARICLVVVCAVILVVSAPSASADEFAYEVNSAGQFGFIDLNTGVFTQLGILSVTLDGLAVYQGKVYGYGAGSGTLYRVDPTNGDVTIVGSAPFNYRGLGSSTEGLYGFDQNMMLYSVDATTGTPTKVGPTGLTNPSGFGVSSGQKTLYITPTFSAGCSGTFLYSVSTKRGKAKLIGSTGACGIGAMVVEDGTLYAGAFSPIAVYTLNAKTGVATAVANVTGTSGYFYGMVPAAQVAP
jgi:hypothetical protein